jgi:hypothetical protein
LKTHYDLLAIERTATPDEVKRAFRREIARYHPDKVQHLGLEFQEIAATRAAELTEAYRILMDVELRRSYDEGLENPQSPPRHHPSAPPEAPRPSPPPPPSPSAPSSGAPAAEPPVGGRDKRYQQERATTIEFLRRALLVKFTEAVEAIGGEQVQAATFDAGYRLKGKRGLFAKAEPAVRLLMRVVPAVDPAAVEESWAPAMRAMTTDETVCLLLLGNGLSPAKELSAAISELRRKARKVGPVVIPVDMRDWEALFPPDTPTIVRTLLERLRSGR